MSKKFLTFGILTIVLVGIFVPAHMANAQLGWVVKGMAEDLFKAITLLLISISSLVLIITGLVFDWIIKFTIVEMAVNIGNPQGIGGGITAAWTTLRDIANMVFIFVLLYAAFKAMFDTNFSGFGTTVKNIIIVALLINFSLFFSKVVIDASNVVATGFYKSIASSTSRLDPTTGQSVPGGEFKGISAGYMNMLNLQTFFSTKFLETDIKITSLMTIAIMSSVFMLITAVIFLISGIMFAARFIILIFIMILSPLALIAYIIPGQKGYFEKWKDALINQSFFAPLFFALTWVVFKLGVSLLGTLKNQGGSTGQWAEITTNPSGVLPLIINYVLIIGFAIAALIISKTMASKAPGFTQVSGGIGTAALGGTALISRNTIGRASNFISETQREKWSKSTAGRAGLWLADKGKKGSFDVRNIDTIGKVPGLGKEMGILGKGGGKGGFSKTIEDKAKAKTDYAKRIYGQTVRETEESKTKESIYNSMRQEDEKRVRTERGRVATAAEEVHRQNTTKRDAYMSQNTKSESETYNTAKEEMNKKEKELERVRQFGTKSQIFNSEQELEKAREKAHEAREKVEQKRIDIETKDEQYKSLREEYRKSEEAMKTAKQKADQKEVNDNEYSQEVKDTKEEWLAKKEAGKRRMESYADRLKKKFGAGNKEASRKVREVAEGKDKKDKKQLKKDLAKMGIIDDEEEEKETKKEEKSADESSKTTQTT